VRAGPYGDTDEFTSRRWSYRVSESHKAGGRRVAKLIYSAITSLDGFTEDAQGTFDWAAPDLEVHSFVNDLERPIGTYLYGRRMYETMVYWETVSTGPEQPEAIRDYAQIWRAADKVVYSRTLAAASSERTRVERAFDPAAVASLKETAARDISIGGPELAAAAIRAGVVDEIHLLMNPILVGGGKPALPSDVRVLLSLSDERRFANGVVYVAYQVRRTDSSG
jgi:dihydrofolate reductase